MGPVGPVGPVGPASGAVPGHQSWADAAEDAVSGEMDQGETLQCMARSISMISMAHGMTRANIS